MVSRRGRAQLAELYFSGTTSAFVLHGNTYDLVPDRRATRIDATACSRSSSPSSCSAAGRWCCTTTSAAGLRAFAGRDEQRLKEMVALANRKVGDLSALPKDPAATLRDRSIASSATTSWPPDDDRLSVAVIIDQASYVFPAGEPGRAQRCRRRPSW